MNGHSWARSIFLYKLTKTYVVVLIRPLWIDEFSNNVFRQYSIPILIIHSTHFNSEIFPKAYKINPFSELWQAKVCGIQNAIVRFITQVMPQDFHNRFEGLTFIMINDSWNIFKKKSSWTLFLQNFCNIEKQSPLCLMFKPLSFANCTEWLARESCA